MSAPDAAQPAGPDANAAQAASPLRALARRVAAVPWSRILNVLLIAAIVWHALLFFFNNSPKLQTYWDALVNSKQAQRVWQAFCKLPADNWGVYEEAMRTHPWRTSSIISGIAYFLADWTAQSYEGNGLFGFSILRLVRTTIVGAAILAPLAHGYYHVVDLIIDPTAWWAPPLKVAIDQTIYSSFYNVVFLGCCGLLAMRSPKRVFDDVREKFWPVLKAGWRLWPAAHIITYTVIPTTHKLLWVDTVEVAWVTYLSYIANARRTETREVVSELRSNSEQESIDALGERAAALDSRGEEEQASEVEAEEADGETTKSTDMATRTAATTAAAAAAASASKAAASWDGQDPLHVTESYNTSVGSRSVRVRVTVEMTDARPKVKAPCVESLVASPPGESPAVKSEHAEEASSDSGKDEEKKQSSDGEEGEEEDTGKERRQFTDPKTDLMHAIAVERATQREVREVLESTSGSTSAETLEEASRQGDASQARAEPETILYTYDDLSGERPPSDSAKPHVSGSEVAENIRSLLDEDDEPSSSLDEDDEDDEDDEAALLVAEEDLAKMPTKSV